MEYLTTEQAMVVLNRGQTIEHFLRSSLYDGFRTFVWIALEKDKEGFDIIYHEVYDDRDEGLDSIYDFSYVEPDDIHGKKVKTLNSAKEAIMFALREYKPERDGFCLEGAISQVLSE